MMLFQNNYEMLRKQNRTIHSIKELQNNSKLCKLLSDEFGSLEPIVNLAVRLRVMYYNLPPSLPVAVMIKFGNYSGPTFLSTDGIIIMPVIINSFDGENNESQHIPLKLSGSITINKSQSLTMSQSIVDLGPSEKNSGLAYVTLSRVRRLSDFMLEPT